MSILDKVKAALFTKEPKLNPPQQLVQEVIETARTEELTDEELALEIVKKLKENPKHRAEFLRILQEQDEIELEDTLTEVAIRAANAETLPDELAKNIAKNLPDKKTVEVLENAEFSASDKVEVIDTLSSDRLKEQQICIELNNLYEECGDMNPLKLEERINRIMGIYVRTERINQIIYSVIARNLATAYHNLNGGMIVGPFERVVPADEMLRVDMPYRVGREYEQILADGEEDKYDREMVTRVFLSDAAKEVVKKAKKADRPEASFINNMGHLTQEEQEYFIEQLKVYKTNALTEREEGIAFDVLNGRESGEKEIQEINMKLKKVSSGTVKSIAGLSANEMEIVSQVISSGLIEELGKEKRQDREKYLKGVTEILVSRRQKEQFRKPNTGEER